MNCPFSHELLALFVEGDLEPSEAEKTAAHLRQCAECSEFYRDLQESQASFKALSRKALSRNSGIDATALAQVRRSVMSKIEETPADLGWMFRLERALILGFRRHRYAMAGVTFMAIVSIALAGPIRQRAAGPELERSAAVFQGKELKVPAGYREWVFVGSSLGLRYGAPSEEASTFKNIYIDPASYRKFAATGKFPEGTVMVMEVASSQTPNEQQLQGTFENQITSLEADVKDSSRFDGGWGFFKFSGDNGQRLEKSPAQPDSAGCRACHSQRAQTDHVFTQFYPVLRAAISKS